MTVGQVNSLDEIDRHQLVQSVGNHFNEEEVRTFCFTLDIDYDDLPATGKAAKIRELVALCLRTGQLAALLNQLSLERPKQDWEQYIRHLDERASPFMGLKYYDTRDAHLFFGRERLTEILVGRLSESLEVDTPSFLAVVGASGSGKSSLLRAGLIPAIQSGSAINGHDTEWSVYLTTPAAHPLKALAISLTRDAESVTAAATLMEDLAQSTGSLDLYAHRLVGQASAQRILVAVDQFEEIFTQCRDEVERQAFIDNLLAAVRPETGGPLTVIITLRADFYHRCAAYDQLRQLLAERQEYIGRMSQDEMRQAIEEPALRNGYEFEEGLVERLLHDVGDEPGGLPLLSHALRETWKRREGRTLTHRGYQKAGEVHSAIANSADSIFQSLDNEERTISQSIFLRLTELGEGTEDTRRRVSREELIVDPQHAPTVVATLQKLVDARLITATQDTFEVAHEALIREWPRLRDWLEEDRDALRILRRITDAENQWRDGGTDSGDLLRGLRLEEARQVVANYPERVTKAEVHFVELSQKAEDERKRAREEARRNLEGYFLSQWIAVAIIGFVLGWLLVSLLDLLEEQVAGLFADVSTISPAAIGAAYGLLVGLPQHALLRWQMRDSRWWLLTTSIGFAVGIAIMSTTGQSESLKVGGALIGGLVGLLQWLGFRRQGIRADSLFLATIIAYTVSFWMGDTSSVGHRLLDFGLLGSALAGLMIGVITGLIVVRVLRQTEPPTVFDLEAAKSRQARFWAMLNKSLKRPSLTGQKRSTSWRNLIWDAAPFAIVALVFVVVGVLIFQGSYASVTLGEPAFKEVIAPRSKVYVSEILTDQARQMAAASVADEHSPLDLSIGVAQRNQVNSVFSLIDVVRANTLTDLDTKVNDIETIGGLTIETQVAEDILSLEAVEYKGVRENILQIVEDTMRQGVLEGQVSEAKQKAAQGAAFDLTQTQERIVTALAPQFILPNIFFDYEATESLRQEAKAKVEPITQAVSENQIILRVGDIVDEVDFEMLQQLGMLETEQGWREFVAQNPIILAVAITLMIFPVVTRVRKRPIQMPTISGKLPLYSLVEHLELLVFIFVLLMVLYRPVSALLNPRPSVTVTLGQTATEDVIARQTVSYVSDVLTDQAREQAAASVADQYTPLDLAIARAQTNQVNSVFSFMEDVRTDPLADMDTKAGYLQRIEGLDIERQVAEDIVSLSASEYAAARDNVLQIVEDTMRQGVLEGQVSEARRRAAQGAAFDLTPAQARIVTALAPQFIAPNLFFDAGATESLRQEAMASVEPVRRTVTEGQIILRAGEIVDQVDLEMLQQLGLFRNIRFSFGLLILPFAVMVAVIAVWWWLSIPERPST